jgi:hypothetical protein
LATAAVVVPAAEDAIRVISPGLKAQQANRWREILLPGRWQELTRSVS